MRVAVLGAGAWGTTLADLLARKGEEVRLWAFEAEVVDGINREHVNAVFLPDSPLTPDLVATGDVREAVRDAEVVVSAAPSHVVGAVARQAAAAVRPDALVGSVSKGLEPERLVTMSTVLAETLGPLVRVAVLSGPSFAQEVYARQPTLVVAASADAPYIVLEKVRHSDRDVEVSVPDVGRWPGRTPVLVDDVISSGGTMIEACRRMIAGGLAAPVCLAVHALFAEDSYRLLKEVAGRIATTNTVPHESNAIDVSGILAAEVAPLTDAGAPDTGTKGPS